MKKIHSKHYGILLIGVAYSAFMAGTIASHAQSVSATQRNAEASDKSQEKKAYRAIGLVTVTFIPGLLSSSSTAALFKGASFSCVTLGSLNNA